MPLAGLFLLYLQILSVIAHLQILALYCTFFYLKNFKYGSLWRSLVQFPFGSCVFIGLHSSMLLCSCTLLWQRFEALIIFPVVLVSFLVSYKVCCLTGWWVLIVLCVNPGFILFSSVTPVFYDFSLLQALNPPANRYLIFK